MQATEAQPRNYKNSSNIQSSNNKKEEEEEDRHVFQKYRYEQ